jgi:hypothetical protein
MISMNLIAAAAQMEGDMFKSGNGRWALSLFLLYSLVFSLPQSVLASGEISSGTNCPRHRLPGPIVDPRQWTLQCLDLGAFPETLTQFEADIDHDGIPELFVSSSKVQGNAGGDYFVFKPQGNNYAYLGSLLLHPRAFKILPMEADRQPRMMLYWRSGAGQGTLATVKYTGREFTVVQKETIEPMGQDRQRYEQAFESSLGSFRPEISPEEALKIADRYVRENQIDLSRQYIHFLRLDYDSGVKRQGFYWRVHWKWSAPRMGGEYGLRIYMDKTVLEEIAGP